MAAMAKRPNRAERRKALQDTYHRTHQGKLVRLDASPDPSDPAIPSIQAGEDSTSAPTGQNFDQAPSSVSYGGRLLRPFGRLSGHLWSTEVVAPLSTTLYGVGVAAMYFEQ